MTYVRGRKHSSDAPHPSKEPPRTKKTFPSPRGSSYVPPQYSFAATRVKNLVAGLRMLADLLERIRKMDIVRDDSFLHELCLLEECRAAASLALAEEGVSPFQGGSAADHSNSKAFAESRQTAERGNWFNRPFIREVS